MHHALQRTDANLRRLALCAGLCCLLAVPFARGLPVDVKDKDQQTPVPRTHAIGTGDKSAVKPVSQRPTPGKVDIDARLVPGAKKADPVRQAAWNAANAQAKRRITDFENAVKSGNADRIRKATLDLQSDPLAVQHLNRSGRTDLIDAHNLETGSIRNATKQNIKDEMVRQWNKKNPNDPITAADVDIVEPTNYRGSGEAPKVGQDWDVTVRVRGKDVPTSMSQPVVEDSFFKAAGGEKVFGKGTTAKDAAHRQAVEVTSKDSLESYKEPDKILGKDGKAPDHSQRLENPEDLGRVIEHKSNQAANKAAESRTKGNEVDAVRHDYEQMRQAVKQYDKVTDPRVKAEGGKVGNQVEKGMEIMREVADLKISPEEGRARLAEMGETPDSIIRKASGQVEAAQKMKPQTTTDGKKPQTTSEGKKPQTSTESAKPTTGDTSGKKSQAATDGAKAKGDAPKGTGDAPKGTGDAPKGTGDVPKATGDVPKATGDAPKATGDVPKGTGDVPKGTGDAPKATGDVPKATVTDAPKATAPDAPKAAAPDAPKVGAPDAPKVAAPDAPTKLGTAKAVGDKVLKGVGAVGDGLDIFGGAKDIKDGIMEGNTEKVKEGAVNVVDGVFLGGAVGTSKMVLERSDAGYDTKREFERIDRQLEQGRQQQMRVDLRKAGYSMQEADAMVDSYAAGKNAALKDAYQKMGKDLPKVEKAAPQTLGEAMDIYGAEVKDNLGDSCESVATQVGKAKDFLGETASDLGEMGKGIVTEKGVAKELAKQTLGNISPSNLEDGYDAWSQSRGADKQIDDAHQHMQERLIEKGYSPTIAKVMADDHYNRRAGTHQERAQEDSYKDVVDKLMAEGFGRTEAQAAVDDMHKGDARKLREMRDKVRERNLRDAEAKGKADEKGDDSGGDDDSEDGMLATFTDQRNGKTEANAESSFGLMTESHNMGQSSTRAEQADADARQLVAAAEGEAQQIGEKAAGSAAAAEREASWGKAIADGLQQGVESGLTSAGSSFGHAAGQKVSDKAFGDPEKKRLEREAAKEQDGDAVKEGGDKKTKVAKSGGKSGGNKKAAPAQKAQTRRAVICKACGSEMTYKGKYYADGTDMYYCPGCKATMHHVKGPCPWEIREVPVGGTSTEPAATEPSDAKPAPPPVKPKHTHTLTGISS
ncbi:MAG: hypothetical protein GX174_03335 [Lentisphaerae bacterium]|jgi:hypothetical protein|nr:hypothetical protein [Lentisphaerota bacterium]